MSDDFDGNFDDIGDNNDPGDDSDQNDWFDQEPDDDTPDFGYPGIGEVDKDGWIRSPSGGVIGRELYGYATDREGDVLGLKADVAPDKPEDSFTQEDQSSPEVETETVEEAESDQVAEEFGPRPYDIPDYTETPPTGQAPTTPRPSPVAVTHPHPHHAILSGPFLLVVFVLIIILGIWGGRTLLAIHNLSTSAQNISIDSLRYSNNDPFHNLTATIDNRTPFNVTVEFKGDILFPDGSSCDTSDLGMVGISTKPNSTTTDLGYLQCTQTLLHDTRLDLSSCQYRFVIWNLPQITSDWYPCSF